jgi:hypothetical protein
MLLTVLTGAFWYFPQAVRANEGSMDPAVAVEGPTPGAIIGPIDIPGQSRYTYTVLDIRGNPTNITWSVDSVQATITSGTNAATVTVEFNNTPVLVNLTANYTVAGNSASTTAEIAVVKVDVADNPTLKNLGKALGGVGPNSSALVADNPEKNWVTFNDPGSDCAKFKYAGTYQAAEPMNAVGSTSGGGISAWRVVANITLTAPVGRPAAIGQIEVGFIQHVYESTHSATYTAANLLRTAKTPATIGLDWLVSASGSTPGQDVWPWINTRAMRDPPVPASGNTWTDEVRTHDSPTAMFPAQWNPNNAGDPNAKQPQSEGAITEQFYAEVAARTKETDNDAQKHYFEYKELLFTVAFIYPVVGSASIVTPPTGWNTMSSVTELNVNITPAIILWQPGNDSYEMWIPTSN